MESSIAKIYPIHSQYIIFWKYCVINCKTTMFTSISRQHLSSYKQDGSTESPMGYHCRRKKHEFSDAEKSRASETISRFPRIRKRVFFSSAIVTHGGFVFSYISCIFIENCSYFHELFGLRKKRTDPAVKWLTWSAGDHRPQTWLRIIANCIILNMQHVQLIIHPLFKSKCV